MSSPPFATLPPHDKTAQGHPRLLATGAPDRSDRQNEGSGLAPSEGHARIYDRGVNGSHKGAGAERNHIDAAEGEVMGQLTR